MLVELIIRFVLGGAIVSVVALVSQVLRPRSLAGIFGAAPSVALVGFVVAVVAHGDRYAGAEAHAMIFGAGALLLYSLTTERMLRRSRLPAWLEAGIVWI